MNAILNHTRVKLPGRLLGDNTVKDQLHPIWPTQIQIVANDFFKELPASQGPVEDLRQAYFHLPDGQAPVVPRGAIFTPQRQ